MFFIYNQRRSACFSFQPLIILSDGSYFVEVIHGSMTWSSQFLQVIGPVMGLVCTQEMLNQGFDFESLEI